MGLRRQSCSAVFGETFPPNLLQCVFIKSRVWHAIKSSIWHAILFRANLLTLLSHVHVHCTCTLLFALPCMVCALDSSQSFAYRGCHVLLSSVVVLQSKLLTECFIIVHLALRVLDPTHVLWLITLAQSRNFIPSWTLSIKAYLERAKLFSLYANRYVKQCRRLLMASSTWQGPQRRICIGRTRSASQGFVQQLGCGHFQ